MTTETWLDFAVKMPGPASKAGYPSDPDRELDEILYMVNHSAEGWANYLVQGHRPGANASWTFSNCIDGTLYQHYPLEALTYTSGGLPQNRDGLGIEHEGVKGTPINAAQVANDRRIYDALKAICSRLREPKFGEGFREHGELTNGETSCPSGRIQPLYDSYTESEDDMTEDEKAKLNTIFAKVEEMWTAMFGDERDSIEKRQHREIIAKLDTPAGGGTGAHSHE